MRDAHFVCAGFDDVASMGLLENWIDNAAFKDGIDFGLGSRVDVPALDITNWV